MDNNSSWFNSAQHLRQELLFTRKKLLNYEKKIKLTLSNLLDILQDISPSELCKYKIINFLKFTIFNNFLVLVNLLNLIL